MNCEICHSPLSSSFAEIPSKLCTDCWFVTSYLEKFIDSYKGRVFVIELMNKPYKEKQDG